MGTMVNGFHLGQARSIVYTMGLLRTLWGHYGHCGFNHRYYGSIVDTGFIMDTLDSSWTEYVHHYAMYTMGPSWACQIYYGHYWSIVDRLGPSQTGLVHRGQHRSIMQCTLWVHRRHAKQQIYYVHYGSIVDRLGPSQTPARSILQCTLCQIYYGHYGSITVSLGSSWTLWVHHGHSGFIVDRIGPLWTLWVHHGH